MLLYLKELWSGAPSPQPSDQNHYSRIGMTGTCKCSNRFNLEALLRMDTVCMELEDLVLFVHLSFARLRLSQRLHDTSLGFGNGAHCTVTGLWKRFIILCVRLKREFRTKHSDSKHNLVYRRAMNQECDVFHFFLFVTLGVIDYSCRSLTFYNLLVFILPSMLNGAQAGGYCLYQFISCF